jgi:hypothetical protein
MGGLVQPNIGVGISQTWQDVTVSRATATTYTNTTGKPILVMVAAANNVNLSWGQIIPTVGGIVLPDARALLNTCYATICFVVPANLTYSLNTSGSISVQSWCELR